MKEGDWNELRTKSARFKHHIIPDQEFQATYPDLRPRNGIIPRHGPRAPARRIGDRNTTPKRDHKHQKHQPQPSTGRAHHYMKNVRQSLRGRRFYNVRQRRQGHADGDDEKQARDAADGDAEGDCVGDLREEVSGLENSHRLGIPSGLSCRNSPSQTHRGTPQPCWKSYRWRKSSTQRARAR